METHATHPDRISQASRASPLIGLLLCVAAANAPFLNQAFHMDDGIYLLLAQNVHRDPWFPQDRPTYFEGLYAEDLASTEHPWPLTSYLMALSAYLAGGFSEIPLHLGFLFFPIMLTCSMYFLARRFTRHPIIATLTLLTLPVVYVLSHTLMTDIPLLSFWVASVALFSLGVDSGRKSWVWLGALAAALSSLVSYSGLCLVPLLCFYAILRKDRRAVLAILILPASLFGFWLTINYFHYRRFTPEMLLGYYFVVQRVLSLELLIKKSAYIVLALGGVTLFPLSLLALSRRMPIVVGITTATATLLLTEVSKYDPLKKILFVLLFCAGFAAIVEIVRVMARSLRSLKGDIEVATDELFLSVWFLGMLIFCGAFYMTGSARYLLPATPPLVLLLVRRAERILNERKLRWAASANLALGGLLALLLALGDYQFAQIYRDFASTLGRAHPSRGGNLWFTGEWGFRAYLEQLGGQELGRRDPRPKPGDLLVVPRLASPYQTLFTDTLSLESIILVTPSRVVFEIPSVSAESALVYTLGMPFYDKSDGMDFTVRFQSQEVDYVLRHGRLLPAVERRWRVHEISLKEIAGKEGRIVFSAEVGGSANADADWAAIARARICTRKGQSETLVYDFRQHLDKARVEPVPGMLYHTDQNSPVFPLTIWLEQEPATVLRGRYGYRPTLPVRLLDRGVHAGFWSAGWGLLPYSFASDSSVLESISVYEIIRQVDSYGESTPSWYPN